MLKAVFSTGEEGGYLSFSIEKKQLLLLQLIALTQVHEVFTHILTVYFFSVTENQVLEKYFSNCLGVNSIEQWSKKEAERVSNLSKHGEAVAKGSGNVVDDIVIQFGKVET